METYSASPMAATYVPTTASLSDTSCMADAEAPSLAPPGTTGQPIKLAFPQAGHRPLGTRGRRPVRAVILDAEPVGAGTRYVFVTNTRRRSTARTLPRTASEPERRGARRPKGLPTRTVAIGLLGAALCLGLGLAIPTAPLGPDSEQVAQSVWSDPRPSFLASAVGGNVAPSSQRGLVPVKAPEVLSVPVAASHDPSAAAGPGGIRVKVFFSRHPESESAFSAVFPVTRVAPDRAVATAALTSLLQGPSDSERASGYFSELGA